MAPKKKPAARKAAARQSAPQVNRTKSAPKTENQTSEATEEKATTEQYLPTRQTLEAADLDQHAVEEQRESERAAQRDEHNRRVSGANS